MTLLLFNRHKKQVTMTPARSAATRNHPPHVRYRAAGARPLSESRALRAGTLRIVADAAHHLLHILGRGSGQNLPAFRSRCGPATPRGVITSLFAYEADIGVLGEIPEGRDFEILKLNSTPIIAFVAAGHPLAKRKKMHFDKITGSSADTCASGARKPGRSWKGRLRNA